MQLRKLGQLGTPVSAVGYGAMSFTDFYGPATEEGSEAILAQCIDLGITHIDTSNAYGLGKSENRIGAFLAKQGKQAQDFFKIATKAGITRNADGKRKFDNSPEHLRISLDASLERRRHRSTRRLLHSRLQLSFLGGRGLETASGGVDGVEGVARALRVRPRRRRVRPRRS